jgi:hypothetical protein
MTTVIVVLAVAAVTVDLYATGVNRLGRSLQATGRRLSKQAAKMTRVRLATVALLAVVAIAAAG